MKKTIFIMIAVLMMGCMSACGAGSADKAGADSEKLSIVTTIFPEYDWVMNILGDNPSGAQVTMLLDNGVDLHSYQPTAADILKIADCDVFVYVGGESDEWVEDALKEATNSEMIVVNLLKSLGEAAKEEELVEGMEAGHDHDHDEEAEYDEHVWLSLKNASALTDVIADALSEADPAGAETYAANVKAYQEELAALDAQYQAAVSEGSQDTVLFGDRFPFRYLIDDYGLSYYAAFAGCSAETEASFETVTFLAARLDALGLHTVLTIEGSEGRIAQTIIQNTSSKDQQILALDSMQATTGRDAAAGVTYLSIMEKNLDTLKEALK